VLHSILITTEQHEYPMDGRSVLLHLTLCRNTHRSPASVIAVPTVSSLVLTKGKRWCHANTELSTKVRSRVTISRRR